MDGWSAVDGSVETNCGENGGASQQRHKLYLVGLRAWRNMAGRARSPWLVSRCQLVGGFMVPVAAPGAGLTGLFGALGAGGPTFP